MSSFALQASVRAGESGAEHEAPIDRDYLARFTMGNDALEREVLELFADQAPQYLDRLRAAATAAAWKEAAHTIKGAAAAVGARQLSRFAELAEKMRPEEPEERRAWVIERTSEATDAACRYIAALFPR